MERANCYAIGVKQLNAKGEDCGGYVSVNQSGKVIVAKTIKDVHNFQPVLDINKGYLVVAENREDAEYLVRWLSRAYRKSFREYAKKHNFSMDDFQFFMVKMSNPAFDDFYFEKLPNTTYRLETMKAVLFALKNKDANSAFRGDKKNVNLYEVKKKTKPARVYTMMPR